MGSGSSAGGEDGQDLRAVPGARSGLAGVLLIFRQPFVSGDQIEVDGIRGTVEGITIRETRIRSFDGRLVIVPNADVYTNAIEVQTAYEAVRSSFVTGVGYDTDLAAARRVVTETLATVDGVLGDPAPEPYGIEHGSSSVVRDDARGTAAGVVGPACQLVGTELSVRARSEAP